VRTPPRTTRSLSQADDCAKAGRPAPRRPSRRVARDLVVGDCCAAPSPWFYDQLCAIRATAVRALLPESRHIVRHPRAFKDPGSPSALIFCLQERDFRSRASALHTREVAGSKPAAPMAQNLSFAGSCVSALTADHFSSPRTRANAPGRVPLARRAAEAVTVRTYADTMLDGHGKVAFDAVPRNAGFHVRLTFLARRAVASPPDDTAGRTRYR